MKNILISSAGRRVSLVKAFQKELKFRFPEAKVFTTDMNPQWSSACRVADGYFQLSRVDAPDYMKRLITICLENQIGLIVPTIDTELLILSEHREELLKLGIVAAVSDYALIQRCRDKRLTNALFEEMGIDVPRKVDPLAPTFPLFIKPYDGSLSRDILLVKSAAEWHTGLLTNEKLMYMEYLSPDDYQEFTVDAFFDDAGELKCLVPRKRVEVRGGEISKGRTEKKKLYETLQLHFRNLAGARSCLTMQFFEHKQNHRIVGIEINPRFGGGFPLTYEAGGNYPAYLVEEYLSGKKLSYHDGWEHGKVMLRYDAEVFLSDGDFIF